MEQSHSHQSGEHRFPARDFLSVMTTFKRSGHSRSLRTLCQERSIVNRVIWNSAVCVFLLLASTALAEDAPTILHNGETAKTIDVAGLSSKDLEAIGKLEWKDDDWRTL